MWHFREYHAACEKILAAPLTLTEHDFDALQEFGGPQDEARGRDAMRRAQLGILTKAAAPLLTTAIDPQTELRAQTAGAPPAPTPGRLNPEQLVLRLAEALRPVLESYQRGLDEHKQQIQDLRTEVAALEALKKKIADLEEQVRQHQASLTTLRADHQALGTVVAAGLEPYRPPPTRDPRGITH